MSGPIVTRRHSTGGNWPAVDPQGWGGGGGAFSARPLEVTGIRRSLLQSTREKKISHHVRGGRLG